MNNQHLFLKPDEAHFLSLSVVSSLDQFRETAKNERMNWNPETRKTIKEIIEAGERLQIKLKKLGFEVSDLPPFNEGDEKEFLTKES